MYVCVCVCVFFDDNVCSGPDMELGDVQELIMSRAGDCAMSKHKYMLLQAEHTQIYTLSQVSDSLVRTEVVLE